MKEGCKCNSSHLNRRYFGKKLYCPRCKMVYDDDYRVPFWEDFLMMIGYIKQG